MVPFMIKCSSAFMSPTIEVELLIDVFSSWIMPSSIDLFLPSFQDWHHGQATRINPNVVCPPAFATLERLG
jgi:hypothetical protein